MADYADKRVLIIDDHPGMRTAMRLTMSNFGVVKSEFAQSANEAIRRIKNQPYDIIVCDYNLGPEQDGQQLLEMLRHNQLIGLSTVFMMVTAERVYEKVVSAAELAPDDYLIKPFTAETFRLRLDRVMRKKEVMAPLFPLLNEGKIEKASEMCNVLASANPNYMVDFLRLKAELLISLGQAEAAQQVYEGIVSERAVPWAKLGLAQALRMRQMNTQAESLLEEVIAQSPEYMAAFDMLANVKDELGKPDAAQEVLAKATAISPNMLGRQRMMGEVALRNGDVEAAEKAFAQVVEKGKTSFFRQPEDYVNLSRALLEGGKAEDAINRLREAKQSFGNAPAAVFAASVMESQAYQQLGKTDAAKEALQRAMALKDSVPMSDELKMDLAASCYATGQTDAGAALMDQVVRNGHEDKRLLERVRKVYSKMGLEAEGERLVAASTEAVVNLNNQGVLLAKQGNLAGAVELLTRAAEQLPNNHQIVLNAAHAVLTLVNREGWNADLMGKVKLYLETVRNKNSSHPKLAQLQNMLNEVQKKYGSAA